MISRGTVVAALLVVELAIIGEAVSTIRGGRFAPWSAHHAATRTASGPRLVEDGPHRLFEAGAHPVLTVNIGNADLTILTHKASQIDVGVSGSKAYGVFRAKAPITVHEDGATIRIATTSRGSWSMGDDRMVTVLVPPETHVTVVNAGDIKASGLRSDATFNSIGSGSVTVEDYDAPALDVASESGPISLHRIVAARLDAKSSHGRVEGTALEVRDGSVESDGRVTLGFGTGADTQVTAETNNGTVNVSGFTEPVSIGTGRRSSDGGADHPSSQTVRVGAGDGHLSVHSSAGNIILAQES